MAEALAPPKTAGRLSPEMRVALVVLLLGAVLRLGFLGSNPPGMFRDEAEKVYTAWSLGLTGHHSHLAVTPDGRPLFLRDGPPLFVDAYGSFTSAIYHWSAVPFALALGPSAWAARLPAALAGLLTLFAVWRYARRAFDAEVALLALFFLAISPWHVLFSRWAQQGIFVPLWLALGLWTFERGRLAGGRSWWLSGVCFGLALYTYAPMRVTVPLFVLALAVAHRADLRRHPRMALIGLLAFLLTCLPTALWLLLHTAEGMQRFQSVMVWEEGMPFGVVVERVITNYLKHFSIPYLFLSGDGNLRHSIPGLGQMHWIELPGLLVALTIALTQRRPQDLTLALWFLLAPVAPSLTRESPHALRDIAALPAAPLLSAMGTAAIFRLVVGWAHRTLLPKHRRWVKWQERVLANVEAIRLTGLMLGSVTAIFLMLQLFLRYPHDSAKAWETGLHEAIVEADALTDGRGGVMVLSDNGALLHYLPSHLRVALRIDPRTLSRMEPPLPPGWTTPLHPGPAPTLVITEPRPMESVEVLATIQGPATRFTPEAQTLWQIVAQAPPG